MSGRARDNRLVHVTVPDEAALRPRPGDFAETLVTYAAPHHLNADAGLTRLRRTRGGDAWAAQHGRSTASAGVNLGLPTIGRPASFAVAAAASACSTH
jgi:tRNA-2-methylthio-N6-dimethylallyladenosine synthase